MAKQFSWQSVGALFALGLGLGAWGNYAFFPRPDAIPSLPPVSLNPLAANAQFSKGRELNFIAQAAQEVGPAVVRIDSARASAPESLLKPFFGDRSAPSNPQERGTGSGFILSPDGRLLTNAHVVEGSERVKVTLKNGQVYEGKVIGVDKMTDLAVVKIDAQALPVVRLGRSDALLPGEWAIAIGNPLGLDNSVTVGIISALGRSSSEVGVPDKRVRFIQTDAAINPGNSGGPLLNAEGEVIGVNTAIRADAQGLGFAIPIETAQRVAEQLVRDGKIQHPYLGIHMVTLTPELAKELRREDKLPFPLTAEAGVLIIQVMTDSPADRDGLEAGDVILSVGDRPVTTAAEVQEQVEASAIGEPLAIEIRRDRSQKTLSVRPGPFPESD